MRSDGRNSSVWISIRRVPGVAAPLPLGVRSLGVRSLGVLALAVLAVTAALIQPAMAGQHHARIVRMSYTEGSVQVRRGDATVFGQAVRNMPLLQGSRIDTGDDGRAEIEFEDGSLVRLTPGSSLSLDELGEDGNAFVSQMTVLSGLAYFELRSSDRYGYLVRYGESSFTPVRNSTVRVNMDAQPSDVAVMDGDIRLDKGTLYSVEVRAGESLQADPADATRYFLTKTMAADSWDDWNQDRDQVYADQASQRTSARDNYAGDNGYGWSDLDNYGNWYPVPGYGLMWQPVGYGSGFDPYGSGYWAFYPTYGYQWVSSYPWGWTPFLCGNWGYVGGFGWGWSPVSGCGAYGAGWGNGFSNGGYINIVNAPPGYQQPMHPLPGNTEHQPRPLIAAGRPMHTNRVNGNAGDSFEGVAGTAGFSTQPILISGRTVQPLRPLANARGTLRNASALQRDFPVNQTTHKPELGMMSQRQASVFTERTTGVMGEPVDLPQTINGTASRRLASSPSSPSLPAQGAVQGQSAGAATHSVPVYQRPANASKSSTSSVTSTPSTPSTPSGAMSPSRNDASRVYTAPRPVYTPPPSQPVYRPMPQMSAPPSAPASRPSGPPPSAGHPSSK